MICCTARLVEAIWISVVNEDEWKSTKISQYVPDGRAEVNELMCGNFENSKSQVGGFHPIRAAICSYIITQQQMFLLLFYI